MAETPSKAGGRLENLSKDELLKLLKKQVLNSKDLKKRLEDLTNALKSEKAEVTRLENEKKDWISHGVSAEFEKKNKITKKEKELELAAHLGKEMLVENDVLQQELAKVKSEYETSVRDYEDELDKMMQDKIALETTLQSMQDEYKNAKQESLDNREVLKCEKEQNKLLVNDLQQKIKDLKSKNEALENDISSNSSSADAKVKKLKEKLNEVNKEKNILKEQNKILELNMKEQSSQMLALDNELNSKRKEILDYQQEHKTHRTELKGLMDANEALKKTFKDSQENINKMDDDMVKVKQEKEKVAKTLKTTRTKLERASQMEEELKKQLNVIVGERDDLMKKLQKKSTTKSKAKGKTQKDEETSDMESLQHIKELQERINKQQVEFEEVKKVFIQQVEETKGQCQVLEKQLEEMGVEKKELLVMKDNLSEENQKLAEDKLQLAEEHQETELKLEKANAEKDILQQQLGQLQSTEGKPAITNETEKGKKDMNTETGKVAAQQNSTSGEGDDDGKDDMLEEETKGTILKLEGRIDELLNKLQRLNEEKLYQENELEELFKSQDDLLNKYDFECKERERVENENKLLEERINQLEENENKGHDESSLHELNQRIHDLEGSLEESVRSRDEYKQDMKEKERHMLAKMEEMRIQRDGITIDHEEMKKHIIDTDAENNKEFDKLYHEFIHLDNELNYARTQLQHSTVEKDALENANELLMAENQELQKLLNDTERLQKEKCKTDEKEHIDLEELQAKYASLEEEHQMKYTKLQEEYKQLLYHFEHEKNAAVKPLDANNDDNVCTEVAVEELSSTPFKQELQGDLQENQNLDPQGNLSEKQLEIEKLKNQLRDYEQLLESNQSVKKSLENELNFLRNNSTNDADVPENNSQIDQLNVELQTLRNAYNETRLELNNMRISEENSLNEGYEKDTEIERLKQEITNLSESFLSKDQAKDSEIEKLKQEVSHHSVVCETKESEIEHLQQSLKSRDLAAENLQTNFESQCAEFEKTRSVLNEKQQTISDLNQQLELLRDECTELQTANEELLTNSTTFEKEQVSLGEKIIELSNELSVYKGQSQEYENRIEELSETVVTLQNEKLVFENSLESLSRSKADLELSFNDVTQELFTRKSETSTLSETVKDLTDRFSSLEKENTDLVNKISSKEKEYNELNTTLEEKSQLLEELKDSIASKPSENNVKNDSVCTESETSQLQNPEDSGNEKFALEKELQHFKISYESIETELQSALNRIEELEGTVRKHSDNAKEKGEKAAKLRNVALKTKKEMESLRTKLQAESTESSQEIERLNEEIKRMKSEMVQQKTNCAKHEEEFEEMQKEIKQLQQQLSEEKSSSAVNGSFSEDLVRLSSENEKLLAESDRLSSENIKLSTEKKQITEKLDEEKLEKIKLESEIEDQKRSLQFLEDSLKELTDLKSVITEEKCALAEKCDTAEQEAKERSVEIEQMKTKVEELQKNLRSAQKDTTQLNLMNLEIDDYLKSIDNLNEKLRTTETRCEELEQNSRTFDEREKGMQDEIASLKRSKNDTDEKSRKMKGLIVKLRKDIEEHNKQHSEREETVSELQQTIEQSSQNVELLKLQIAELTTEKEKLNNESLQKLEGQQKSYQTLEVKYARSMNDLTSSQLAYDELQREYEEYKVRARNVLKQQKEKNAGITQEQHQEEVKLLQDEVDALRKAFEETKNLLKNLESDHVQLEEEYEQQTTVHAEFVKELREKETGWKTRYKQLKQENEMKNTQFEEKIGKLMSENTNLLQSSKDKIEELKNENEKYTQEISELKHKIQLMRETVTLPDVTSSPEIKKTSEHHAVDHRSSHLLLDFSKYSMERQEGEGMDQSELEIIDTLSQRSSVPQTPMTPTAILENILISDRPQTPLAMKDELIQLKGTLVTSLKKNDHMTELLRESEANASRLYDQAIVLKEEIRRLERNEKRQQETLNMEYLKNVIMKFLKVTPIEKEQLIPVLCTMLKLSDEEKTFIKTFAKGDDDNNTDDANTSWSSYVYRWTSIS